MDRREYLTAVGGAAAFTAGCITTDGSGGEDSTDGDGGGSGSTGDGGEANNAIVAEGPVEPNDNDELTLEEIWYYLENAQESLDLSISPEVHDVRLESGEMQVSIELQGNLRNQRIEQIAAPAIMYSIYLDQHGEPDIFRGYVVDAFGDEQQTFHCERSWAEQYFDEEVSGNEFGMKVFGTLQPV